MTKTLIYIGGSLLQLPSIKAAQAVGLRVIVTDTNPDAPGAHQADGYEQISGDDTDALCALAAAIGRTSSFAGCYCGSDFGLKAVATVSAAQGTPAPSPADVARALDKTQALDTLRAAGVAVPPGRHLTSLADLQTMASTTGLPLIIKPIDSSGSRGVRTVTTAKELAPAYEEARTFSRSVMAEQIVTGDHIDANGIFVDGVFHPCGLLSRYFSPPPFHYPTWGTEPCLLPPATCASVYQTVEAAARALGLTTGPVKADVIVSASGPVILEVAPRFHGDVSTSFVTPLATGSSGPRAWFAHLAGQPHQPMVPQDNGATPAGWMGIFPSAPGIFDGLAGVTAAAEQPGIRQIATIKKPGYSVRAIADNLAVMGFIWAVGRDATDVHRNLCRARLQIQVHMKS